MKRILVTSALPYANGPMHIGQLAGCYLPADIYTRYQRLKKRDVIHICGTDEHGVLITLKALQEKTTPREIVDKYHHNIKTSLQRFGIEYTNFSRTSKPIHYKNAQNFFLTLYQKNYIEPKTSDQLYCEKCNQFLPERFVEGICPYCGNDGARGDQCEKCGRWLEPTMLKSPKCQICGSTPKIRSTTHWFFRLDLLQKELKEWIKTREGWRENVTKFVNTWLKEGLEPRPVTRDIDWGVPVPLPDAKGKVIYVWFEALIGYISGTMEWDTEKWKAYWMNGGASSTCDKENELVHFIAKDNIVFHAIMWPAMLLAHGDFILPTQIPANEFLNLEGRKISTSRNWAIWLDEYLEEFEPDPLRYALTVNAPEHGDVDFKWDEFLTRNNSELSDILGNFIHRTTSFITKHLDGKIPHPDGGAQNFEPIRKEIDATRDEVAQSIEKFEFKKAIKTIMELAKEGNRYFDYNKPWEMNKMTNTTIYHCATLCANLAILLDPFLPFTAKSIREMLSLNSTDLLWDTIGKLKLPDGMKINQPQILFKKIEKKKIEAQKLKLTPQPTKPTTEQWSKGEWEQRRQPTQVSIQDFEKLDIRIAEILEAQKIEGTKKLMKLKINIGEETRQIIAGIAETYSPQELIGKKIVVLTNLEPRTIHGEQSYGMLLAAVHEGKPILLIPDRNTPLGSPIL